MQQQNSFGNIVMGGPICISTYCKPQLHQQIILFQCCFGNAVESRTTAVYYVYSCTTMEFTNIASPVTLLWVDQSMHTNRNTPHCYGCTQESSNSSTVTPFYSICKETLNTVGSHRVPPLRTYGTGTGLIQCCRIRKKNIEIGSQTRLVLKIDCITQNLYVLKQNNMKRSSLVS